MKTHSNIVIVNIVVTGILFNKIKIKRQIQNGKRNKWIFNTLRFD